MSQSTERDEVQRNRELLSGMVLGELTQQEAADAERLLASPAWQTEKLQLELAAAAIDLGWSKQFSCQLSGDLKAALQRSAEDYFDGETNFSSTHFSSNHLNSNRSAAVTAGAMSQSPCTSEPTDDNSQEAGTRTATMPPVPSPLLAPRKPTSSRVGREWLAWCVCAASLLLAIGLWWSTQRDTRLNREALLALGPETLQVEWQVMGNEAPNAAGDVIWNQRLQTGYMRFSGLPKNIPGVAQYQLWIIDANRGAYPVDGGVFDIPHDGEVLVPIQAKLAVGKPKAFAITIEKPGGVVVSDQSRLPLLAPVPE